MASLQPEFSPAWAGIQLSTGDGKTRGLEEVPGSEYSASKSVIIAGQRDDEGFLAEWRFFFFPAQFIIGARCSIPGSLLLTIGPHY